MNDFSNFLSKVISIVFATVVVIFVWSLIFGGKDSTEIKNYISSTIGDRQNDYVYNKNDYLSNDTIKAIGDINKSHENVDLQIRPQFYVYSTDNLKPSDYDEKIKEYEKSESFASKISNDFKYDDKKYIKRIIEKWKLEDSQLFTLITFDNEKKELFINTSQYVTKHILSENDLRKMESEAKSTIEKDGVNKAIDDTVKKLNEKYSNVKVEKIDKQNEKKDSSDTDFISYLILFSLILSLFAVFSSKS